MSTGGGPTIIYRTIPNQAVLDALVALTGQNFNFDKQAWKNWHAAQRKAPEAFDGRTRLRLPRAGYCGYRLADSGSTPLSAPSFF